MKALLCHVSVCLCLCSTLWAQPPDEELTIQLPGDVSLEMVWIEPGTFMMGTTEAQKSVMDGLRGREGPTSGILRYRGGELPAHQVTISKGFYLGKFEVTQAQWEAVMETTYWLSLGGFNNPDKPAIKVSWLIIQRFMDKLNEIAGESLYRFPTEAEWEYACRGGTETLWFTGDDPSGVEGYINFSEGLLTVGSLLPNPLGLYDMSGNAGEWVLDGVRKYTAIPQVDPIGPTPQKDEVRAEVRGASGGDAAYGPRELRWYSRCASRPSLGVNPGSNGVYIGFRLLRRDAPSTSVEESGWGQVKGGQAE